MGFSSWLKRPYPFDNTPWQNVRVSLLFGLFVFLFLFIFQPFTAHDGHLNTWKSSMGFGLVTFSVMLFNYFIPPLLFPKWLNADRWLVRDVLINSAMNILIISLANWTYYRLGLYYEESSLNLLYFLLVTTAVGIFPVTVVIFWFERIYYKRNSQNAEVHSRNLNVSQIEPIIQEITLRGEGKNDILVSSSDDLICFKSEGNYVNVFELTNGSIQKKLIRVSLKDLENQLKTYHQYVRVHLSYMINIDHLKNISGNARGYLLELSNIDFTVPVSRKFDLSRLSRK